MWHLHLCVPVSHGSQAEGSGAALASSKICAEIRPSGPGENQSRGASCHLAGHVLHRLLALIPTCCSLPPPPRCFFPNPLCRLASFNASFAPGFPFCPRFCSLLPWSSIPIALPRVPSPYGLRDLERCSPGTGFSPSSTTDWGKKTIPPSQKRDTPNDVPYQSPQVHFASLSSRLKGEAGVP